MAAAAIASASALFTSNLAPVCGSDSVTGVLTFLPLCLRESRGRIPAQVCLEEILSFGQRNAIIARALDLHGHEHHPPGVQIPARECCRQYECHHYFKSRRLVGPPSHLLLHGTEMLPLSPLPLYLLRISRAGALMLNLDEQHRQLLRLLGSSYEAFYL
jgi:hypothetical protein